LHGVLPTHDLPGLIDAPYSRGVVREAAGKININADIVLDRLHDDFDQQAKFNMQKWTACQSLFKRRGHSR
jgi:hypothetical protein